MTFDEVDHHQEYIEKSNEYESKVFEISLNFQIKKKPPKEVYITLESMFNMLNRLPEIYKSSNTIEKNEILKRITSNSVQYGNKADINFKKPFLYLSNKQDVQHWHEILDICITIDWEKVNKEIGYQKII